MLAKTWTTVCIFASRNFEDLVLVLTTSRLRCFHCHCRQNCCCHWSPQILFGALTHVLVPLMVIKILALSVSKKQTSRVMKISRKWWLCVPMQKAFVSKCSSSWWGPSLLLSKYPPSFKNLLPIDMYIILGRRQVNTWFCAIKDQAISYRTSQEKPQSAMLLKKMFCRCWMSSLFSDGAAAIASLSLSRYLVTFLSSKFVGKCCYYYLDKPIRDRSSEDVVLSWWLGRGSGGGINIVYLYLAPDEKKFVDTYSLWDRWKNYTCKKNGNKIYTV